MSDTRGVFKLQEVVNNILENEWVDINDVWISPSPAAAPNTGYFGGGGDPGVVSTMDKVTYASDTTAQVPGAALSAARRYLSATGNSTAGYFGGGNPGPRSTMDKVTYASDTRSTVPGAFLSGARNGLAASSARANALPQPTYTVPTPVNV